MNAFLWLLAALTSGGLSYLSFYFGVTTLVETIIVGLLGTITLDFTLLLWKINKLSVKNKDELDV